MLSLLGHNKHLWSSIFFSFLMIQVSISCGAVFIKPEILFLDTIFKATRQNWTNSSGQKQYYLNPLLRGHLKGDHWGLTMNLTEILISGPWPYGRMCVVRLTVHVCMESCFTSSCSTICPPPHTCTAPIDTHAHALHTHTHYSSGQEIWCYCEMVEL